MTYEDLPPGAILTADGDIVVNAGVPARIIKVANRGSVPVHLTAHFHVFEANPALCFDRRKAFGMRPDLPVGWAIRIEPGETVEVPLVPIQGRRIVHGFHGIVDGPLDMTDPDEALQRLLQHGFCHEPEE